MLLLLLRERLFGQELVDPLKDALPCKRDYPDLLRIGCNFVNNSAGSFSLTANAKGAELRVAGQGGAISVTGNAALRMRDVVASGNRVLGGGDGGFLFASSLNHLLVQRTIVERGFARRGGAFAVLKTQFAFEAVTVRDCVATEEGGAMLIDEGAESHLLGCHMDSNAVRSGDGLSSRGGHIAAAS